ncbi:GNAT family N-acetyltransferase [Algoriphagus mannitolivorans]|uniref:GNAT family N-acetyltransferase n=1 Tax=Algoriphagus mannitolivorans TaxID=226504 RepID=UPI000412BC08|nr:GNAT family N-acetyltransferase [Algoriphagus mannitolivorans]
MSHPLDNPIWSALTSGSAQFSHGTDSCRFIDREMGFFAGLPEYSSDGMQLLQQVCEKGQRVILFPSDHLPTTEGWKVLNDRPLLQMVYSKEFPLSLQGGNLKNLNEKHVPSMLALTELTKPGPFLNRTLDFGGYVGAFDGEILISMAGRRLSPDPYVEISAVCTHPDYLGKGLSAQVMTQVMKGVLEEGKIPFLHVYPDNVPAVRVYERLGFRPRTTLRVYLLEKI